MDSKIFIFLLGSVLCASAQLNNPAFVASLSRPAATGGGAPTGNSFTIRGFQSAGSSTSISPVNIDGSVGDIWVVWFKWEGSGTVTSLQGADSGTATARGSKIDHANGDLHSQFYTVSAASTTADEDFTITASGTLNFRDWAVWRLGVSGTLDYSIFNGSTATSSSASSGNITTVTQNGIVLVGVGVYNSCTFSSEQVAGNAATNVRDLSSTSSQCWDYVHTSQISSGQATGTISTSLEWTCNILALSAQ